MAYIQRCIRCGVHFERGIPTLRVVDHERKEYPLCNRCNGDLRMFLKGATVSNLDVNAERVDLGKIFNR